MGFSKENSMLHHLFCLFIRNDGLRCKNNKRMERWGFPRASKHLPTLVLIPSDNPHRIPFTGDIVFLSSAHWRTVTDRSCFLSLEANLRRRDLPLRQRKTCVHCACLINAHFIIPLHALTSPYKPHVGPFTKTSPGWRTREPEPGSDTDWSPYDSSCSPESRFPTEMRWLRMKNQERDMAVINGDAWSSGCSLRSCVSQRGLSSGLVVESGSVLWCGDSQTTCTVLEKFHLGLHLCQCVN